MPAAADAKAPIATRNRRPFGAARNSSGRRNTGTALIMAATVTNAAASPNRRCRKATIESTRGKATKTSSLPNARSFDNRYEHSAMDATSTGASVSLPTTETYTTHAPAAMRIATDHASLNGSGKRDAVQNNAVANGGYSLSTEPLVPSRTASTREAIRSYNVTSLTPARSGIATPTNSDTDASERIA